jgi:hypothetical protein
VGLVIAVSRAGIDFETHHSSIRRDSQVDAGEIQFEVSGELLATFGECVRQVVWSQPGAFITVSGVAIVGPGRVDPGSENVVADGVNPDIVPGNMSLELNRAGTDGLNSSRRQLSARR